MSGYIHALTRLRQNVRAEVSLIQGMCGIPNCGICDACTRLLKQLDADVREVKADVGAALDQGAPF